MDNGGPAFPTQFIESKNPLYKDKAAQDGMTLRDYFAAKALEGLLARGVVWDEKAMAIDSYKLADQMLKARLSPEGGK